MLEPNDREYFKQNIMTKDPVYKTWDILFNLISRFESFDKFKIIDRNLPFIYINIHPGYISNRFCISYNMDSKKLIFQMEYDSFYILVPIKTILENSIEDCISILYNTKKRVFLELEKYIINMDTLYFSYIDHNDVYHRKFISGISKFSKTPDYSYDKLIEKIFASEEEWLLLVDIT